MLRILVDFKQKIYTETQIKWIVYRYRIHNIADFYELFLLGKVEMDRTRLLIKNYIFEIE